MNKFLNFLKGKTSLIILFLLTLGFNWLLSHFMPKEYALDLKFAYNSVDVSYALSSMGAESRSIYQLGVWALDLPYLFVYGLFTLGLLHRLYGKGIFLLLPPLVSLMDLCENFLVLELLDYFPKVDATIAFLTSCFTTTKWVLVAVLLSMIIVGVLRSVWIKRAALAIEN